MKEHEKKEKKMKKKTHRQNINEVEIKRNNEKYKE